MQERHGIFVEARLRQLIQEADLELRVCAPVPWFPFQSPVFGSYSAFAQVPQSEVRKDIEVLHPRYPVIPKIGMSVAPLLMAYSLLPIVKSYIKNGYDFDLIDSHFMYPDGVAAAIIAKHLRKPVTITVRGSDINLYTQYTVPSRWIRWAANQANAIIAVCQDLADSVIALGIEESKVHSFRNGVDLSLFKPGDRDQCRHKLGFKHYTVLSVGNLVPLKGHDLVIRALAEVPDIDLAIIGEGPIKQELQQLAQQLQVSDRVSFIGTLPQEQLVEYYTAGDCLVLASSREGWANVLLEAMACGTPAIATDVGGNAEVLSDCAAGTIIENRSSEAIASAIKKFRSHPISRSDTLRAASKYSWKETSINLDRLFRDVIQQP